jgi:hypothetical protein
MGGYEKTPPLYTDDQMCDFARAAIAAHERKKNG